MTGARRDRPGATDQPALFDLPLQAPPEADPELDLLDEGSDMPLVEALEPPTPRRGKRARASKSAPPPPEPEPEPFESDFALIGDDRDEVYDEPEFAPPLLRPIPGATAPRPVPVPPAAVDPPVFRPHRAPEPAPRRTHSRAPFTARLKAVAVDAGIHLGVGGAGALAAFALEVRPGWAELPGLGVFLLFFSFLYTVVPLAFWGRTPGMAAADLVARSDDDLPLSFGQTGLRWLAGLLTVVTLGLPLLVSLTGRSLADRMSGSETFQRPA